MISSLYDLYWATKLAQFAYEPLHLWELDKPDYFQLVDYIEEDGVEVLVAVDGVNLWCAFTGTESSKDLLTDLRYVKTDYEYADVPGARVHKGAYVYYSKVNNILHQYIKESELPVKFTGHSLGGMLVHLACGEFTYEVAYTFGCPQTGNPAFCWHLARRGPIWNFVNHWDFVTKVPFRYMLIPAIYAWLCSRKPSGAYRPGFDIQLESSGHAMQRYVEGMQRYVKNLESR